MVLRNCYGMCGTDVGHDTSIVLRVRYEMSGIDLGYAATRYNTPANVAAFSSRGPTKVRAMRCPVQA
eukprot:3826571-Rhodomonas_salina.6